MKKQKFIQNKMGQEKAAQKKMGFSLIELSVVILIIGLLVIGVTKGAALMTKSRLTSAKTLTASSPVLQIASSDLVAWYEPVLDSSFNASQRFNETSLTGTAWFDNSASKSNPAGVAAGTPKYIESSTNNLPAVRFGGDSALSFNAIAMNQKADYTIFVVERRGAATSSSAGGFLMIGGAFGYATNTTITMPGTGSQTVPAYDSPKPRILTFLSSGTALSVTKGVFVNGGTGNVAGNTTETALSITAEVFIGKSTATNFYTGDISEIIIYSKALAADERNDIQKYLSKKYGITVTDTNS